jgi:hypothetical protein
MLMSVELVLAATGLMSAFWVTYASVTLTLTRRQRLNNIQIPERDELPWLENSK